MRLIGSKTISVLIVIILVITLCCGYTSSGMNRAALEAYSGVERSTGIAVRFLQDRRWASHPEGFGTITFDASGNRKPVPATAAAPIDASCIALSSESLSGTSALTAAPGPSDAANRTLTRLSGKAPAAMVSGGKSTAVDVGSAYISGGAVSGGTISLGSVSAARGDMVTVPVYFTDNPGIIAARLQFNWNGEAMALFDTQDGGLLGAYTFSQDLRSPYTVLWENGTSMSNFTGDGMLMTLTFYIPENTAAGEYTISISAQPEELYDKDLTPVNVTLLNGTVTVMNTVTVKVGSQRVVLRSSSEMQGNIIVANYAPDGRFLSASFYPAAEEVTAFCSGNTGKMRIMWVDNRFAPLCEAAEIQPG